MPRYIGAYRGGVRPSAPTTVYRTCALSLPCHSEPVLTLAWESVPRARRRGTPSPPSAREVARSAGGRDMPRQRRGIRGDAPQGYLFRFAPLRGHRPLRKVYRGACSKTTGGVESRPYAHLPHLHLALALSFRASAHTGVGIRSPRPQARNALAADCPKGHSAPAGAGHFCPRRQKYPKTPFKPAV